MLRSSAWSECEAEAMKSVQAAASSKSAERASKLYRHAEALCPRHPKILNMYGEFLEKAMSSVVEADHLFVRAIAYSKVRVLSKIVLACPKFWLFLHFASFCADFE